VPEDHFDLRGPVAGLHPEAYFCEAGLDVV
jgi:hypothetical protein